MAQRILFEREVEKRLLELYQELDRRVGEILRDNQYDLAKAAKISLLLQGSYLWERLAIDCYINNI